ncbi:hypothetical protein AaE_009628, partial [Aphanomyces astaci]
SIAFGTALSETVNNHLHNPYTYAVETANIMKRWPFLILFFVNAIAVGILVAYGQETVLAKIPTLQQCDHVQRPHCMGNQTIFRASMAIGVFFLFMMGWSASTESGHNRGCTILALELPLYAGLSIGAFFVPNNVFDGYAWVAAVASGVFIVMQIVILLDCVYDIRDYVLSKIQASPDSLVWPVVYLLLSFSSLVATIVGLVYLPPNDAAAVVTDHSSTCDNDVAVVIADAPPTAPSWQFFFIMFVSSFYMAMVMTNWGVNETQGSDKSNVVSVWVQIVSQWTTSLLFLWSLVAPVVLPHRDFA